jgi:hypothetical protein
VLRAAAFAELYNVPAKESKVSRRAAQESTAVQHSLLNQLLEVMAAAGLVNGINTPRVVNIVD